MIINCLSCKSDKIELIGKIPSTDVFGGKLLSSSLDGRYLYSCKACNYWFRFPRIPKDEMDDLYRAATETHWTPTEEEVRVDWKIASRWINSYGSKKKVLDVGCFSGEFLKGIGNDATLYGIEIHQKAANQARQYGVKIIGDDFKALESIDCCFDVVTSFDVIEHVYDPKYFLRKLANVAKPNGDIIISTGNTEALSWRLMGSRYWYCTIAEHISFINPKWCQVAAKDCGLRIDKVEFFSHTDGVSHSIFNKIKETGINLCYKYFPFVSHWLRKRDYGEKDLKRHPELFDFPPSWMSAKDHFIVRFRKIG